MVNISKPSHYINLFNIAHVQNQRWRIRLLLYFSKQMILELATIPPSTNIFRRPFVLVTKIIRYLCFVQVLTAQHSAVADMGDLFATVDMGRGSSINPEPYLGGCRGPFRVGETGSPIPHPIPPRDAWHLYNKSSAVAEMGDRGHNRHGPTRGGGCCAPFAERWEPV